MRRLLALAFALIPAAHAETYKWVDEKGVVNYSNSPPPASVKKAETVADRISIYEPDQALKNAVAYGPSPYEQMAQQEWMQRQRLMAQSQQMEAMYAGYPYEDYRYAGTYPYYPAYYPTYYTRAARPVRPVHHVRSPGQVRVVHHRGGTRRF